MRHVTNLQCSLNSAGCSKLLHDCVPALRLSQTHAQYVRYVTRRSLAADLEDHTMCSSGERMSDIPRFDHDKYEKE